MNLRLPTLLLLAAMSAAHPARAEVSHAKPYARLAGEVVGFLFSDVGHNGIRTNDGDPEGYPVPPYFYSYAINDGNNLDGNLDGYPGYLSVSYPAYTASVAIDAFLDWRRWSGDDEGLARARAFADWVLEHRTPPGDLYGNLPYSTQTDGVMGGGQSSPGFVRSLATNTALKRVWSTGLGSWPANNGGLRHTSQSVMPSIIL